MRIFQSVLLVGFLSVGVLGQEDRAPISTDRQEDRAPISTDRPSFTTDSGMMTPGEVQLELGYTYTEFDHGHASSLPEASLRYGLNKDWELRLGWSGYDLDTPSGDFANGTSIGFKWKFKDAGEDFLNDRFKDFDMALITTFAVPTGHGPNDFDYEFLVGWNYKLDDSHSLSGSLGLGAPTDLNTADRFTQGIFSIMHSKAVDSDTFVFSEFYTNFPAADGEQAEFVLQTGYAHRLDNDTQMDFRVGFGLNDDSPDWLIGFGFSRRF